MKYLKEVIKRIKLQLEIYFFKKNKLNYSDKNIYFFLAADYGNLGDVAITYAQKKFLEDNFNEYTVFEIPADKTLSYIKDIKKNIKKDDIVTIVGGGNLGNIYEYYEGLRRLIIRTFKNNLIVSFPQTIDFTDDEKGKFSKKLTINDINNHKNIIVFARENNSYRKMKEIFNCPVYLAPDIVLYLCNDKDIIDIDKTKCGEVGTCFRDDKEINKNVMSLRSAVIDQNNNSESFTTYIEKEKFKYSDRYDTLFALIKKVASYDYVITDRLHAMIFSFLTKTKCYYLDNSNHKISQTKKTWLANEENIIELDKETIINNEVKKFNYDVYAVLKNEFDEMRKEIIKDYGKN